METTYCKLEIFLPESHLEALRQALQAVDAGHIGRYDSCLSYSPVTSCWRPLAGTKPFSGQVGQLSREEDGSLKLNACAGTDRRGKTKNPSSPNLFATEKETEKEKRKEAKEKSKEKNKKGYLTLSGLPEPVQHILNAWNRLPLDNHFDGLYPRMLNQLQALLERYGEAALLKAVANVAESSFLLGTSRNSRGWSVSLGWMLQPEHLENILQGKYRDKKPRGDSLLFQPGDEQTNYNNGFYGTVVD